MATKTQHQEITLTRDEVERGRAQVASELDAAQAAVDQAAYRAAIHHAPEHREALVAAQQRLAALQAELSALDAVSREVVRVERRASQTAAMAELDALEAEATNAIEGVRPAYEKASKALTAFAEAWRSLQETKVVARTLMIRANPGAVRVTHGQELNGVEMAVREQILREFGESLSILGVVDRTPEQIEANVTWSVDAARRTIAQGIQEARDQLQSVMAAA